MEFLLDQVGQVICLKRGRNRPERLTNLKIWNLNFEIAGIRFYSGHRLFAEGNGTIMGF